MSSPEFPIVLAGESAAPFDPRAFAAELVAQRAARPTQPTVDGGLSPVMEDLGYRREETGGTNPPYRRIAQPDGRSETHLTDSTPLPHYYQPFEELPTPAAPEVAKAGKAAVMAALAEAKKQ